MRSRTATTSPTTSSAGGSTRASRAASAMPSSGASTTLWRGVVASTTSAAGVEGGRPPSMSARAMPSRRPTPISTTSVSVAVASSAQRTCAAGFVGSSWPVTTAKLAATPRCVTGMPAAASPPIAEVTPGTTVASRPAPASASSSSPPRPKTNGSPPLSRTTRLPARACSTSAALICSCVIAARPGALPTSMRSASEGHASRSSAGARRS